MLHSVQNLAAFPGREPLSDESKKLLQAIFKAIPEQQREDFLAETYHSLDEERQNSFWSRTRRRPAEIPTERQISNKLGTASQTPTPAPGAAQSPTIPRRESLPSHPPEETTQSRETASNPGNPGEETLPDMLRLQAIHGELDQFKHQSSKGAGVDMKRQLLGCLGLILLAFAILAVLGVGGRTFYDWLLGLLS